MGGDSACVRNHQTSIIEGSKVFIRDQFIFGWAGSPRLGQLLRYKLLIPLPRTADHMEHMASDFIDSVRECLETNGFTEECDGKKQGGKFLVGYNGTIYMVDPDYQVTVALVPYNAIGTGDDVALGVFYATTDWDFCTPEYRIKKALEAAEYHGTFVRAPFTILKLDEYPSMEQPELPPMPKRPTFETYIKSDILKSQLYDPYIYSPRAG